VATIAFAGANVSCGNSVPEFRTADATETILWIFPAAAGDKRFGIGIVIIHPGADSETVSVRVQYVPLVRTS